MTESILLFIAISALTIASPGPGIVLTLTNSAHYGYRRAFYGVLGVASGMGVIALMASTSLGVALSAMPAALSAIKLAGAMYLAYMGLKLLRSAHRGLEIDSPDRYAPTSMGLFLDGMCLTFLNPKPIIFFTALFPQFIDPSKSWWSQFGILATIFVLLVVWIHTLYSLCMATMKHRLASEGFFTWLNRCAGGVFMLFSLVMCISEWETVKSFVSG